MTMTIEAKRAAINEAASTPGPLQIPVDWEARKRWWLEQLNVLYGEIRDWCGKISNVKVTSFDIALEDRYIGSYTAQKLVIYVGGKIFFFNPVGCVLIGARGRVDILWNNSKTALLLLERKKRSCIRISVYSEFDDTASFEPAQPEPSDDVEWCFNNHGSDVYTTLSEESFIDFILKNIAA